MDKIGIIKFGGIVLLTSFTIYSSYLVTALINALKIAESSRNNLKSQRLIPTLYLSA